MMRCQRCSREPDPTDVLLFDIALRPILPETEAIKRTVTLCADCVANFDFGVVAQAMASQHWAQRP